MKKRSKSVLRGGFFAVIAVLLILPVMVIAGSLEPSAAPAPTMKTLDQIPPTWSEKITTGRFVDALGGVAVLDRETGLVWEKSTSTSIYIWTDAMVYCTNLDKGGRKGWHLPTVEQLASLLDTDSLNPTALPDVHPFTNVYNIYWTSTADANLNSEAWYVSFYFGSLSSQNKYASYYVRCVRGGQSHDGNQW